MTPKKKSKSLATQAQERMIARLVAIDEQPIHSAELKIVSLRDLGIEPFYTSDGQFCGGIESEWYKKDGKIYKFMFDGDAMLDATSENDLGQT